MIGYGGRTRWTQAELRSAPPAVLDAARWELYADHLWPDQDIVDQLMSPDREPTHNELMARKSKGRLALQAIRRQLLPADEVT